MTFVTLEVVKSVPMVGRGVEVTVHMCAKVLGSSMGVCGIGSRSVSSHAINKEIASHEHMVRLTVRIKEEIGGEALYSLKNEKCGQNGGQNFINLFLSMCLLH